MILSACTGGASDKQSKSATPTSKALATFDVTATDYVLRFNSLHRLVLGAAGTVVSELTATPAGAGLFGNNVSAANGIFLVAERGGDKVQAAVITAPLRNGSTSTPTRLLMAACANLFDTDRALRVPDAFSRDALPKLESMSPSSVISVGGMFDMRLVVNASTAGFACVPPGAEVPAAARNVPAVADATTVAPTTATPKRVPAPVKLQGTGKTATQPFSVEGGLVTFRSSYQGTSNFIVTLSTTQGDSVGGSLVNVVGAFDGLAARNAPAGQHLLNVEASGPWTITMEQPRPTTGDKLPITYDGKGQGVAGPFEATGSGIRFALKHSGSSNFVVRLLDKDGQNSGASLVNEVGSADVS